MDNSLKFRRGDRLFVVVEKVVFEGPGLARVENGMEQDGSPRRLVIFIDGVAPGDEVEIELVSLKRNLGRGRVLRFIKMASGRILAACPHFGLKVNKDGVPVPCSPDGSLDLSSNCGGCTWQFLKYEDQLKIKSDEVWNSLVRIGGIDPTVLEKIWRPIMSAENPWGYRNKMDFSICTDREGQRHLGLHMRGRYYDVTEIQECRLFRPWVGEFLNEMRPFLEKCELDEGGEFKSLMVRAGTNSHEVLVNLLVENADTRWSMQYSDLVREFFQKKSESDELLSGDRLVSIYLTSISNKKGQRTTQHETLTWGKPTFDEYLNLASGSLRFEVAPQAFLQPNTRQAERFYSLVTELAELKGTERVLDLFCGTGTIGICLSSKAGHVTGLELNASAVENARQNAALNGVSNIDFVVGDATKLLPEICGVGTGGPVDSVKSLGKASAASAVAGGASTMPVCPEVPVDLIVVDPPRAGLTAGVIETIARTAARRLIYVSCNPATLARDLKMLLTHNFKIKFAQAIDQFSQTYHTETVVMLER